ncbi:MAG TPA: efflux RND transporter periplasmic adaptor subunit [Chitinophagaceae bacterium]|nr:efflux RND transporter periplasmic adaptor subunit [Chitinophagaceae bacterium]
MKRKTIIYLLVGILLLIFLLLILKSKGVIGQPQSIKVTAEAAEYKDITETVSASGKIYPEIEVKVSPDVSGQIISLPVLEGDSVTRGQVIAKIYADIYNSIREQSLANVSQMQAQLANAQASLAGFKAKLDQTKAIFARDQQLVGQKIISQVEYEQAQSDYQSALASYDAAQDQIRSGQYGVASSQATLSQAEETLGRTTIYAPMSGYISSLLVKNGERVVGTAQMAGTEMMTIANMDTMEVRVDVGENDIPKVNYGDTANIQVDAYNDRNFIGVVTRIATSSGSLSSSSSTTTTNSSADQVTNYTVHIRILKSSYADLIDPRHPRHFPFRPGMSASVDIQTETHKHVIAVPINAVTTRDTTGTMNGNKSGTPALVADTSQSSFKQQEVVFVIRKSGTVRMEMVKTGIQDDNNIEIDSGLIRGDKVVTAPYTAISKTLQNGSKVSVVPQSQLFMATK